MTIQSKQQSVGQRKVSFIEEHRRKQIIDTAIETISRRGYNQTSLADIAKDAGISKGVISYHFNGKEELLEQVIATLMEEMNAYVKPCVESQSSAFDKLRAYIEGTFDFISSNRSKFVASSELFFNFSMRDERGPFSSVTYNKCRRHVEKILQEGQESGEFRPFPLMTMATIIQGALDGVSLQWVVDMEAVDLDECCQKIFEIMECYVLGRKEPSAASKRARTNSE